MKSLFKSIIVLLILSLAFTTLYPTPLQAADARDFNAGRIIDDGVFTDTNSMTVANIQSFLNSKVPTCDTYGVKPSELGGGTRAQWLASRGISVPITCLKDYHENPSNGQNNYGKAIPSGAISAAQIIYNYSLQFNINPQVIVVTLQKENGLITDEWPTPKQYSEAMGFGCPDNVAPGAPACDPSYGSFSAQIYQAARHFRGYINNAPGWWVPFTTGNNAVRWHPNAACGSSSVNIVNRATVALYSYTPYQPNTAAKNAQWGHGDDCSSYGNRNFYMYFTSWFGSTYGGDPISTDLRITSPISISPSQPVLGQPLEVSFAVRNFSSKLISYDTSLLQCRMNGAPGCDSPWSGAGSMSPGETRTVKQTISPTHGGVYTIKPFFFSGGLWTRYGTHENGTNSLQIKIHDLRITSPITISPENPRAGEKSLASFTIKNFGTNTIAMQTSVLQCRFNTTTNCDSPYGGSIALASGESLNVSYPFTPPGGGVHTIIPYFREDNTWHLYRSFESLPTSLTLDVPDIRFTSSITASPASPIPGQSTTITYSIKNFGISPVTLQGTLLQCRRDGTVNCDTPFNGPTTLQPGEERAFSHQMTVHESGEYKFVPYARKNNTWYEYTRGAGDSSSLNLSVPRYVADLRMTSDIDIQPEAITPGGIATVKYTIRNFGSLPAFYQDAVLQCRRNTHTNCDSQYTGAFTLNPGESRTFTENITLSNSGDYVFKPYFRQNNSWHLYNSNGFSNQRSFTVATYRADMRLTSPIAIAPASPTVGQPAIVSYTVKNFGSLPVIYQSSVLQCRRNLISNCDSTYGERITLEPDESRVFSHSVLLNSIGTYTLVPHYLQDSLWHTYNKGLAPSSSLTISL